MCNSTSASYEKPSTHHLPKGTALFTFACRDWPLFIQPFSLSFGHLSLVEAFKESLLYKFSLSFVTHVHTHVIPSVWRPLKEKSLMSVIITWRVGVWPRPAVPHQTLHFMCQDERFKENWGQIPSHRASEPFYGSRAYSVMKYFMELMTHFIVIETVLLYFCDTNEIWNSSHLLLEIICCAFSWANSLLCAGFYLFNTVGCQNKGVFV